MGLAVVGLSGQAAREGPAVPVWDFSGAVPHEVLEVTTGSTLVVRLNGEPTTVRLIGTFVPSQGWGAEEALGFSGRLLAGEAVYLEYEADWPLRDRQGRTWAYVYRAPDGLFVNLELVRQGYARLSAPEPFAYQALLREYELRAQEARKGLWNPHHDAAASQPAATQPGVETAEPRAPAAEKHDPQAVMVYVTPHGKKYHREGCQYLRPGAVALTLAEARARGYTACSKCGAEE